MNRKLIYPAGLFLMTFAFSGCGVVEAIFKTGMWTGVIIVVAILALVVFAISRAGKK